MEDILIQKITLKRAGVKVADFDLSYLTEITVIETIDLSGPRLLLVMRDQYRIIRDFLGAVVGDVLEVLMADRFGEDAIDKTISFDILTMPVKDDTISFNGLESSVAAMKKPVVKAMLFPNKPVKTVLSKVVKGIKKVDVGKFPEGTWHLLPHTRASKMLRQMARENGAACFWRRGTLVFRSFADLMKAEPVLTYEHNNAKAQNKIISFNRPATEFLMRDRIVRRYVGWDMLTGVVEGAKGTDAAQEFIGLPTAAALDGHHVVPFPVIDFIAAGSGTLRAGDVLKTRFHVNNKSAPIDESMPTRILITTVAHFYKAQKYACRVQGGIIL